MRVKVVMDDVFPAWNFFESPDVLIGNGRFSEVRDRGEGARDQEFASIEVTEDPSDFHWHVRRQELNIPDNNK